MKKFRTPKRIKGARVRCRRYAEMHLAWCTAKICITEKESGERLTCGGSRRGRAEEKRKKKFYRPIEFPTDITGD